MFHKKISLLKSIVRIAGFLLLITNLISGIVLLIIAEILGIVEEL